MPHQKTTLYKGVVLKGANSAVGSYFFFTCYRCWCFVGAVGALTAFKGFLCLSVLEKKMNQHRKLCLKNSLS
jgi:hypothetical protein